MKPKLTKPTEKQKETYDFIVGYNKKWGFCPFNSDIAKAFGISTPSAHQRVEGLIEKGWLKRNPNRKSWLELI